MPQDYKTSINNLVIVWQGQSWSVITPDGIVLDRFKYKPHACSFARGIVDYLDSELDYDFNNNYKNKIEDGFNDQDIFQVSQKIGEPETFFVDGEAFYREIPKSNLSIIEPKQSEMSVTEVLSRLTMPIAPSNKTVSNKKLFIKTRSNLSRYIIRLLILTSSTLLVVLGDVIWAIFAPLLSLIVEAILEILAMLLAIFICFVMIASGIVTAALLLAGLVAAFSSLISAIMWWIAAFVTAVICMASHNYLARPRYH